MALAKRNEAANVSSDINVTPMVDVMLVLLIIFMVITPMLNNKVNVDLPVATQAVASRVLRIRAGVMPAFPCCGARHFHKIQLMPSDGSEPIAASGRPRDAFGSEFVTGRGRSCERSVIRSI